MIADLMIKYKLMINFHGSTKPMGEGRTWPNFLTAEGVMGLEHYKWSDMPNAEHNCTVPFTRNVAGPMDYTPLGLSVWDNYEGKEVLIKLREGKNRIRLFNPNGTMSHIRNIALTLE